METGSQEFYPENERFRELVETIVQPSESATDLLEGMVTEFDASCSTISSDQILSRFTDEQAHPIILQDERFDRDLFRACLLINLLCINEDEIPLILPSLEELWHEEDDFEPSNFRAQFGQFINGPFQIEFSAMDSFVRMAIFESYILEKEQSKEDPLEEPAADREWKIAGLFAIKEPIYEDALTPDFLKDLYHNYPFTVIRELEMRYTPDLDESAALELVDQIIAERASGITPEPHQIALSYLYGQRKMNQRWNVENPELTEKEIEQQAIERLKYLRSKVPRQYTNGGYHEEMGEFILFTYTDPDDGTPHHLDDAFIVRGDERIEMTDDQWQQVFGEPRQLPEEE